MMMNTILNEVFAKSTERAKYRYWMISDLQQGDPRWAKEYMTTAMNDINCLKPEKMSGICYLGDAAEGRDPEKIKIMLDMQIGLLESLAVPIYYVMGNHEFDYYHHCNATKEGLLHIPFYETVRDR
ncbi:MAG: metallophosphoesterase, partial [Lentisphaeria bacterium]|nr:metallophosphoesterase [Lentisphaeria bacterium]